MTKVPTVMPSPLAKITAMTSMPSMAPPNRMAVPLPIPEIKPPNRAQRTRSCPAKGEADETSIGRISVMRNDARE